MGRAQERFKSMLKEHLAPALRELGFKGSGQTYTLDDADYYVTLGIQRSRRQSDAEHICFRLNMSVANKRAWKAARAERPELPERPKATSTTPARRLHGPLNGPNVGNWWVLATEAYEPRGPSKVYRVDGLHRLRGAVASEPREVVETDEAAMAATVVDAVQHSGIPAILAEKMRQSSFDSAS